MIELTEEQVSNAFRKINLTENYNFFADDLVKLANGFAQAAAPAIIKAERDECVKFTKSLNLLVGQALEGKRNAL
jgi:hypothetical protein